MGHDSGTLEPGKYILLKYLDPPWQGFYDVFKIINNDLLIGRVYLGEYPHGARLFTFPMSRRYTFADMTVDDHAALYAAGSAPTPQELNGVWRMDTISNANHATGVAYLQFQNLPDGRFVANYELMGLMEGLVTPSFLKDHFQLNDFTPFHDEIRNVTADFLVGKYMTQLPPAIAPLVSNSSLGLFHTETGGEFGFYYMLTRATETATAYQYPIESVPRCPTSRWRRHEFRRRDGRLVFPGRQHVRAGTRGRSRHCRAHSGFRRSRRRCSLQLYRGDDYYATSTSSWMAMSMKRRCQARSPSAHSAGTHRPPSPWMPRTASSITCA